MKYVITNSKLRELTQFLSVIFDKNFIRYNKLEELKLNIEKLKSDIKLAKDDDERSDLGRLRNRRLKNISLSMSIEKETGISLIIDFLISQNSELKEQLTLLSNRQEIKEVLNFEPSYEIVDLLKNREYTRKKERISFTSGDLLDVHFEDDEFNRFVEVNEKSDILLVALIRISKDFTELTNPNSELIKSYIEWFEGYNDLSSNKDIILLEQEKERLNKELKKLTDEKYNINHLVVKR